MKIYAASIDEKTLMLRSRESYYARQKRIFVVLIGAVSLVPLFVQSWASSDSYLKSWVAKTSSELAGLAESRRETIEHFLRSQENLLAGFVELYGAEDLASQPRLEGIFSAINKSGVITDLGVIDAKGNHLAYVGPHSQMLRGRNYSEAEWFRETIEAGRYVSDVFLGYRGIPHLVVAVADDKRSWVLRATINSELFNGLLESATVGPGGDAYIVNRKGELQTPSRLGLARVEAEGDPSSGGGAHETGRYLTATVPLKGGDWDLVLKADKHTSLSGFYNARKRDIAIMVVSGLSVLSVATLLVRSIVGKIEKADRTRAALNDRVREAEKMALLGRVAASVAHEINNPLQVIGDQAGLVEEMLKEERGLHPVRLAEYQEAAGSIRRQVRRASHVTHRLLGFSRQRSAQEAATDLNRLLEETIGFLENEAALNGITVSRHFGPQQTLAVTDACQLQQVLLNILNNAVEAIGREGSITVRTSLDGGRALVEIADSGPGLPAGAIEKIFDPFYTTKGGSGTGLGLSISYNIMQRLGGGIEARNGRTGGSVFTISVPAAAPQPAQAAR